MKPDAVPRTLAGRAVAKVRRLVRDAKRRRILDLVRDLPPSPPASGGATYSVHQLLCARDLAMAIVACKTLNLAVERSLPWVFHEDGSLRPADVARLRREFPGALVVPRAEADARMATRLGRWPRLADYRRRKALMLKVLDFAEFAGGARLVGVDSDIAFFERPDALLAAMADAGGPNVFNRDIESAYVRPADDVAAMIGVASMPDRINSGLFALDRAAIDYDRIDRWLEALARGGPMNLHRLEQTLFAMAAAAMPAGSGYLPAAYDVDYDKEVRGAVCKHYVGYIRFGFELEAVRYLVDERDFIRRWRTFAAG